MLSPFNLLLITAVFSVVMLFVLGSLMRSGIPGIKDWLIANAMATVALLLFAGRGTIAPILSIEGANGLLSAAMAIVYVGYRRFLGATIPTGILGIGLAITVALIAVFHYGWDQIGIRILIVSIFHGAVCFAIGWTVLKYARSSMSRYPYRFTAAISLLFGIGHLVRGAVYAIGIEVLTVNTQVSPWNTLFLSIGTLVLPVFTMGAVMIVHDKMMAKATDDANRDFLTGAWSRRAFFEFAERELIRVQRTGRALSLLIFDVDYFKKINDTHGHSMGDRVLLNIVQRAEQEIRSMDYIARLGGEEFAVLLPEVDAASALVVAERLRVVLEAHGHEESATAQAIVPYTVSIGVATRASSESIAELIHRTDIALYDAKSAGRNRVIAAAA